MVCANASQTNLPTPATRFLGKYLHLHSYGNGTMMDGEGISQAWFGLFPTRARPGLMLES